ARVLLRGGQLGGGHLGVVRLEDGVVAEAALPRRRPEHAARPTADLDELRAVRVDECGGADERGTAIRDALEAPEQQLIVVPVVAGPRVACRVNARRTAKGIDLDPRVIGEG